MIIYMECTLKLTNNQVYVEGEYEQKTTREGVNYLVIYDNADKAPLMA